MEDTDKATFDFQPAGSGQARLILTGRLDRHTTASIWRQSTQALRQAKPRHLVVQAGEVVYCDGAGIGLLTEYRRIQEENAGTIEIRDPRPQFGQVRPTFHNDRRVS